MNPSSAPYDVDDELLSRYENLYNTLISSGHNEHHNEHHNDDVYSKYKRLDAAGQNILYILYCIYIHKHQLTYKSFVVKDALSLDKTYHNVWLNLGSMPPKLKGLLINFVEAQLRCTTTTDDTTCYGCL